MSRSEGGGVRRGGRGDLRAQAARLPGEHQHHVLQHRHPAHRHRRAELPQRRPQGRPDADLPGLRLREGPGPGALPGSDRDQGAVQEGVRRRLNHSPLFLDFLEGKTDFSCTAWGIPSYSLLGWQRPCYLMADGYARTYAELVETTDWEKYGRGRDPRCANCMAHCGYEPSAVLATMGSLRESLRAIRGS